MRPILAFFPCSGPDVTAPLDTPLAAGLYLVATPIGSARDITLRALDILASADVIAAEDTRNARKLMEIHGIARNGRPIHAYHDHNGAVMRPRIVAEIAAGKSVAFVSDAGTPLIADPGFVLARETAAEGLPLTAAPGASALLAALAVAGLPTDRFLFAGFVPAKAGARARALAELAAIPATLVFYEAPSRLPATLAAMIAAFGPDRPAALCRELTKRFEQVVRGRLDAVAAEIGAGMPAKGEFVIVLGPPAPAEVSDEDLDAALRAALATMSVKDAATAVAGALHLPRKAAYARALVLSR